MRVLFTGGTSFTGRWFIEALAQQGHSIVAALQGREGSYAALKAERIKTLSGLCKFAWERPFGTPAFLDLIAQHEPFDILCHHAADVTNYKSLDFDEITAAKANALHLRKVLQKLHQGGCRRVVLTGSVFEANEGAGSSPLRAFSPYSLSKTLTGEIFSFHAEREGLALGKFVIANPFGPYEEPRFTEYLLRSWKDGKTARVNTPRYVRDNIHVSLLAAAYARFASTLPMSGFHRMNPSFYVETQGTFASRFAKEIGRRLKIDTLVELANQSDFSEPAIRINTDLVRGTDYDWEESVAWDRAAQYYAERFGISPR